MANKKAPPDWERIEADYRAGVKSIREIAAENGITDTAIRKRAKAQSWERDLAAKVTAKAEALVRAAEVRGEVRTGEREIVDANAQAIANVKLAHRADIRRYRALVNALLSELEAQTGDLALYEQLGELMRNPDADRDTLAELYRKVIALPQRTKVMIDLANALKVLVALERESYGLKDEVVVTVPQGVTMAHALAPGELRDVLKGIIDEV